MTTYATAPQVRRRYAVSDMTIWRWLENESLGFPKPMYINGRRYWAIDALAAFDQRAAAAPAAAEPVAA